MNETNADVEPQGGTLPPSKKGAARHTAISRANGGKQVVHGQLRPRRSAQGADPGSVESLAKKVEVPKDPALAKSLDEWMEATAEMIKPGGEGSSPSLPPRGELLTLAFTLGSLEAELEGFLYRLAFDSGSWIMELSDLEAPNGCHLRLLVYEDAAVIAEILAADDRPSALGARAARSMLSLGWEPPSQPAHPVWTAGSPATHSDIGTLSAMIIATLQHVLGLAHADRVALTLYGA
ncbi:MAG: hypothetical protein M0Z92_04465 [Actinomycetota bacterium]|nr:hypothetical protein [Actinomycetota bacterium]